MLGRFMVHSSTWITRGVFLRQHRKSATARPPLRAIAQLRRHGKYCESAPQESAGAPKQLGGGRHWGDAFCCGNGGGAVSNFLFLSLSISIFFATNWDDDEEDDENEDEDVDDDDDDDDDE